MKKCLFFCLMILSIGALGQTVYQVVTTRLNAGIQSGMGITTLESNIATYKASLQSNGRWNDITNYGSNPDVTHLNRIKDFARGYTRSESMYKDDLSTYNAIVLALNAWYSLNPVHSNWWYNDIGYPQIIGQILILMRYGSTPLPATLEGNLINRMKIKNFKTGDGANTSDEALHYLYRACLTESAATLDSAARFSFEGISYGFIEGLSYDNSFTAHGRQLSTNAYGDVFVRNCYNAAGYLYGTPYALSSTKLAMLNNFYRNTFVKSGRGNHKDFSTLGRGISRGTGTTHSRITGINTTYLSNVRLADPLNNAVWDSIASGVYQSRAAHNRYWWSDYDLHLRAGYSIGLRTSSNRTIRTERGNNENKLGKFLPDGATSILRIGAEYDNIYPIWEWDKIPGTTSRDFSGDAGATISIEWGYPGTMSYVGGVTDSLYGATTYDMSYNGVAAKKSYFFFDKEMVCLGSGIASSQAESIITSINQCWLYGAIKVNSAGTVSTIDSLANTAVNYNNPSWVLHDNTGYFFPAGGSVSVSNRVQTGNWNRINSSLSATPLSGSVFNMWLNHGTSPNHSKYAYVVVPNLANPADMANYNLADIRIVKNSDSIQAVRHLGLDMMQVIFYKAGTLTDSSITVTVNSPCMVMLKNLHGKSVGLSVADPAQLNTSIKLSFQLPGISGGVKSIQAILPAGNYAGSSAYYKLDSATHIDRPVSLVAVADAYVRNGIYATVNYGTAQNLVVKNDAVDYQRQTYLKFDPRDLIRPVSKAVLRVYSYGGNVNVGTTTWNLYTTNSEWGENTINWNNKPISISLQASLPGRVSAGFVDFDITTLVNNLDPDSLLSLQLVSTALGGTTDAAFASRENTSNKPTIILDNTPPKIENINVSADAFVKSGVGNTSVNYGSETYLVARSVYYETFLKFDLNNILGKVIDAKLRLKNQMLVTTQLQLYKCNNNSWAEYGITWDNKPMADSLLTTITAPQNTGYFYWDITKQLKNIGLDGILTLKVVATENAYTSFSSRESPVANERPVIVYMADTTQTDMNDIRAKTEMAAPKIGGKNY